MVGQVRILDVDVDALSMEEAVTAICAAVDARRGHGAPPIQVATVNPEFVMLARRNQDFLRALRDCAIRTADGVGLLLAARMLGRRLPGRVSGVDLVRGLAAEGARRGYKIFLLGAAPGVAEAAAAVLESANPGLAIAGCHAGIAGPEGDAESLALIRRANADIVCVAYGAPQQELWGARNLAVCGAAVSIGVGGSFDYLSGRVRRAPTMLRRVGLEWCYRLVVEPWRARRMAVLPLFVLLVARQRVQRR